MQIASIRCKTQKLSSGWSKSPKSESSIKHSSEIITSSRHMQIDSALQYVGFDLFAQVIDVDANMVQCQR